MQPNQELVRGSLRGSREERHGRHRRMLRRRRRLERPRHAQGAGLAAQPGAVRSDRHARRAHRGTFRGGIHCVLANDHHVVVLQRTRGELAGRTQLEDPEVIVFYVRPQSRSSRAGRLP